MPWEKHHTQPCGLKGRESERHDLASRALAALQAAPFFLSFTQGIGLRLSPGLHSPGPLGRVGSTREQQIFLLAPAQDAPTPLFVGA